MLNKTTYAFFKDSDAEQVAQLFNRNKFYIGKFKVTTGEEYLELQKKRGMLFSVVAKKDDKVIGVVCAYPTSGHQMTRYNQVFVGSLLLDIKYRLISVTIIEMYRLLISKIVEEGYDEILTEVSPDNKQSLYMMSKFGFFMLNNQPNIFGYCTMHNYSPVVLKGLNRINDLDNNEFFAYMPIVDKKNTLRRQELLANEFVEYTYKIEDTKITVLVNINANKLAGVNVGGGIKYYPALDNEGNKYLLKNQSINSCRVKVAYDEEKICSYELSPSEEIYITYDEERNVDLVGDDYIYHFLVGKNKDVMKATDKYIELNGKYKFEIDTGTLMVSACGENVFKELWPLVKTPYLEGALRPRVNKKLRIEQEQNELQVIEETTQYILERQYEFQEDKLIIGTKIKAKEDMNIEPMVHLWCEQDYFKCSFQVPTGIEERVFNGKISKLSTEDLPYVDFSKWEYGDYLFEGIDLLMNLAKYSVSLEHPAKFVINDKYIAILYGKMKLDKGQEIDLEKICYEYGEDKNA